MCHEAGQSAFLHTQLYLSTNFDHYLFSNVLLKSCPAVFSDLIAHLANLSFFQGHFLTLFKSTSVTPLHKKPGLDKCLPSNYRPISNLNTISKVLERLFLNGIQSSVVSTPNFNPSQNAYRPRHSTETCLLATLDNIFTSSDLGNSTLLVSLALSAAFEGGTRQATRTLIACRWTST